MWQLEGGKYHVQMLPLAGTWYGKIISLGPGVPPKDTNNPDSARRPRNLVGIDLFWNLRWNPAARKFTGGQFNTPDRGR